MKVACDRRRKNTDRETRKREWKINVSLLMGKCDDRNEWGKKLIQWVGDCSSKSDLLRDFPLHFKKQLCFGLCFYRIRRPIQIHLPDIQERSTICSMVAANRYRFSIANFINPVTANCGAYARRLIYSVAFDHFAWSL